MSVQINVQASQTALAQSIAQGVAAFNARYAGQNQLNLQVNARSFSQPLGRITSDLADFESALKASNARVLAFGASTAVLGGVVRSFKEIANVTIEVEKSLTDINRVLNLSTNNLQKFSSELFSISKQTASSFDDATKAALEFSRQGLNTEETLKRTADALTLVRLTGISSTKAVEDLTATVNGFSKAGITTSQVVNKLAAVEQDFAVSASDLTEALSRTGQAAQEAGVSFDELNALVTTAQQNTARGGAVIGNALKTIFTRLQRTETLDQLENFNIAVRDVQGNILPAVQILKNFADQYNNLADAQRAQLSEQVAGVYQVNILKGVISDLNNSQGTYVKALERGSMAANEADIANQKLNKTLSALVTQTGIGLQQLANNVGKVTFAPIFEAIVSPVNDAVSYINDTLEGEGIGSIFANGLLKGIRNVFAGPGLAVGFAVIAKVAKNTFEDATKALPAILGLTTEAQKRANIEKSIISILQTQSNLSLALQGQQGNLSSQAATVLNYAKLQTAQYQQQLQIAQQLAPLLAAQNVTVGARGIQVGARIKAGGHIPAFAEMSERMGAAMGGYKSGRVVKAPKSVGANTYMNSAEEVKYVPGFAQPFINPPANSKAGRAHRQNAINRTGVDPYTARGFVPNFAKLDERDYTFTSPSGKSFDKKQRTNNSYSILVNQISPATLGAEKDLDLIGENLDAGFNNKTQKRNYIYDWVSGVIDVRKFLNKDQLNSAIADLWMGLLKNDKNLIKKGQSIGLSNNDLAAVVNTTKRKVGFTLSELKEKYRLSLNPQAAQDNEYFKYKNSNKSGIKAGDPIKTVEGFENSLSGDYQNFIGDAYEKLISKIPGVSDKFVISQKQTSPADLIPDPTFIGPHPIQGMESKAGGAYLSQLIKKAIRINIKNRADDIRNQDLNFGTLPVYQPFGSDIGTSFNGFVPNFSPLIDDNARNKHDFPGGVATLPIPDKALQNIVDRQKKRQMTYLDFDRTLVRTMGDIVYSRVSPDKRQGVLNKMFEKQEARLSDIKNSKLTQFGKLLHDKIKLGLIDPDLLGIMTASGKVEGMPEFIYDVWKIPKANQFFRVLPGTKEDKLRDLGVSASGFIPNFAIPVDSARIPWFKKYASSYKNTASDKDVFRQIDFPTYGKGLDHSYAKIGNPDMISFLYEDFVRSAMNIALGSKQIVRSKEAGFKHTPTNDISNRTPIDLAQELAGGKFRMLEVKQSKNNQKETISQISDAKLRGLFEENPQLAKNVELMTIIFNDPRYVDPTGKNPAGVLSPFEQSIAPIVKNSYADVDPVIKPKLSKITDGLLRRYQAKKNLFSKGFIPNFANYNNDALERMVMELAQQKGENGATLAAKIKQDFIQFVIDLENNRYAVGDSFHKDIIAKNFGKIVSDNDLVSPGYANTYLTGSYDKNSGKVIYYKSNAQKLDPLFERKHSYIKRVENELKERFAKRQQNAPVKPRIETPYATFHKQYPGPSNVNDLNNGFIPNFANFIDVDTLGKNSVHYSGNLMQLIKDIEASIGRNLSAGELRFLSNPKTDLSKLNDPKILNKFINSERKGGFAQFVNGFIPNFANKSIADHKSIRAIYDLFIGGKKINEKNGTLDELLKIADPNNKQFKQLKTKGTPWTVQDIKGLPISEGIYANGFIPNFAYKQSVMGLEESMSGKNAILDTTTGPFPFIRNSSQPNFASAISDHGGLKNALNDSMRNQEAAGLMSNGYIPNFATVNANVAFPGYGYKSLKPQEQQLFVEMNKALSKLTRDLTLTSQQQNTLRQTILNNANALQASTGSTNIVTEANNALATSLQQNANAQQKAAAQAAQQQAAQQPVQQTLSTRLLGTSRGGKIDKMFGKLSNSIGFNLAAPLLGGVAESLIAGGKDRSEMGYGRRLASTGASAALTGLSTGAAIGSAIPGVGTAAGAAIGAIVGFAGAAVNAKDSLDDLQKVSEKYRNETQTAVESGKGIINIIKSLNDLDPNSLEAFDANQKLQDYFVKLADTGLENKFREAGNDIESMTKAIKNYETERATQAKRNSENEKRKLDESLSIEDIRKKGILKVEDIIEKRTYRKFKPTEEQKRIYGPNVTEGMVPLGLAEYENATYDVNMGQRIAGTGAAGEANFQTLINQYPQLFDDLKKVQNQLGVGFKNFSEILKDEGDDLVFNQGKLSDILKENPIEGIDPDQLADTLQTVAKDSGLQGKLIIEYFDQIMAGLASGKFKTVAEAAAEVKNKIIARQEGIRQKLFQYSQAIEQSISEIGIQIENYEFEKNFGKLNLEKSAQIINEGFSAISKNINDAFKNQFDFIIEQTSVLQQKRLLDFEAQNFQKDLAAQAESRKLGRAKELVSVLQTALSETAADQLDILVSQFRSTGKVDISGIDQKYLAKPGESKRALQAFNLTTKISEEEAKNKEENARRIFMVEQAYAKQSLQLKNETSKLDYDLSERRYKNTVREKELVDSISNQSRQIQIKGQAQIERSRIEAESPYFMLGRGENAIADEKRRREAAATQQGFELEARQAIADAEIAKIQREVFADNTKATLNNTIAIEALIMSMTKGGADAFTNQTEQIDDINRRLLPKDKMTNIDERIKSLESMNFQGEITLDGREVQSTGMYDKQITDLKKLKQEQERLRKEKSDLLDSSAYAANKAASEIYNSQMQTQIARQTLAKRPVKGLQLSGIDLSTIKDPIKYLNESVVAEKEKLNSIQLQKENLESLDKQGKLSTEQRRELVSLNDQFSQQTQLVNTLTTAQLSIEQKINTEYFKRKQYIEDIQKRGTFTAGVAKAVGTIRTETEMFKETLGSTTVNAFRDGLVGAMDAALNKADDLDSALRQVAAGFLREIQGVMLRNIANQFVSSIMPEKFVATSAVGEQKGGYIRAQNGMYISGASAGDKYPAMLEGGEYVLNSRAVKKLGGRKNLDNLNFNTFPRFATGGDPGAMSASADAGAAFERLSMFGREQSPEFQTYMDKIREEEAIKEKKRAERKALLNQFLGTLITTGISMGLSSAFNAAKESSMASANLKGATGTLADGTTTTQVTSFADAKSLINSGGSVTLSNGSVINKSSFGTMGITKSSFNDISASRFAASGMSVKPGSMFGGKPSYNVQGTTTPYNALFPEYGTQINANFANPGSAYNFTRSIGNFQPRIPNVKIGRGRQEGGIIGLNQGGFLPYGSRLTDSIPAYLSGGEYVVNSRAVRKYGVGGMNRINSGVARFEDGGLVGSEGMSGSNTSNTSNSNIAINITVNATNGKSDNEQSDNNGNGTEGNAKELSNRIKSVVLDVITNEQRTGGLLDSTKKK